MRKISYVLWRKHYAEGAGVMARVRCLWHVVIRRHDSEICDCCGRPVNVVWWCHDDRLWENVTGRRRWEDEPAGGTWCIPCFDREASRSGWIEWAPVNLRHLDRP